MTNNLKFCVPCAGGFRHTRPCPNGVEDERLAFLSGPNCKLCFQLEEHTAAECTDALHPDSLCTVEEADDAPVKRVDAYNIEVDGHFIPANEDQEQRIRAFTPEQRWNLLKILGKVSGNYGDEAVRSVRDAWTPPSVTIYDINSYNADLTISGRRAGKDVAMQMILREQGNTYKP